MQFLVLKVSLKKKFQGCIWYPGKITILRYLSGVSNTYSNFSWFLLRAWHGRGQDVCVAWVDRDRDHNRDHDRDRDRDHDRDRGRGRGRGCGRDRGRGA